MRTLSKFSYSATLVLALVLTGCAATKSASAPEPRSVDGDAASAALHEQALRALDARMFVIKGDEFYLPGDKIPVKQSPDSYISMQGTHAVIRLSPNLFPRSTWRTLNIEDDAAEMTLLKRKRSGDLAVPAFDRRPPKRAGPGGDRDAV